MGHSADQLHLESPSPSVLKREPLYGFLGFKSLWECSFNACQYSKAPGGQYRSGNSSLETEWELVLYRLAVVHF